jgi:sporulation protein YlmC with PRC-barrel domain
VEEPGGRTHVLLMPRDLIHRAVSDPDNHMIGYVRDILIDERDWQVRFLHVTVGGHLGIGDKHFLIPIEAVERVSEGFVTIEQSREKVQGAPELNPNILLQPDLRHEVYEYYGYPPPA